ncbi:hypothetical protein [Actinomadura sp. NBRC 104425]|nr:hypothetical protein [Actinomadura sp. NBRC 104425]
MRMEADETQLREQTREAVFCAGNITVGASTEPYRASSGRRRHDRG